MNFSKFKDEKRISSKVKDENNNLIFIFEIEKNPKISNAIPTLVVSSNPWDRFLPCPVKLSVKNLSTGL